MIFVLRDYKITVEGTLEFGFTGSSFYYKRSITPSIDTQLLTLLKAMISVLRGCEVASLSRSDEIYNSSYSHPRSFNI